LRFVGVVAGIVATCVAFWLLFFVIRLPLFPNLYPEGVIPTGFAWYVHVVRATIPSVLSLLLTFFLGGLAAGVAGPAFSGRNGALGAAITAIGAFAWFVAPLVPSMWEPMSDHVEVYVLNEGLGTLIALTIMFCVVLPFIILAGYLGARFGGRLRNWLHTRPAGS
jgi:hypothetical protein